MGLDTDCHPAPDAEYEEAPKVVAKGTPLWGMSYAINNMETHTLEYIFGSADRSIYGGSSLPTLALSCSMLLIIWIAVLVSTL